MGARNPGWLLLLLKPFTFAVRAARPRGFQAQRNLYVFTLQKTSIADAD